MSQEIYPKKSLKADLISRLEQAITNGGMVVVESIDADVLGNMAGENLEPASKTRKVGGQFTVPRNLVGQKVSQKGKHYPF